MPLLPTRTDSWQAGYLRVDGKDLRSNTAYMWGHILAATEIRISTEFDSASSTTAGIQEAIDDLPAAGGMVFIPAGTHDVENIVLATGVTIMGAGESTVLRLSDARNSVTTVDALAAQADLTVADGTQFNVGDGIFIRTANALEGRFIQAIVGNVITVTTNLAFAHAAGTEVWTNLPLFYINGLVNAYCRISNLTVDGNEANSMVGVLGSLFVPLCANQDNSPRNAGIERNGSIYIYGSSDIKIDNIRMNDMPGHGVFVDYGSDYVDVVSCRITNVNDKGLVQVHGVQGTHVNFLDNYITNTGLGAQMAIAGANWGDGIQYHGSVRDCLCRGNYVEDVLRYGIHVRSFSEFVTVTDNIVINGARSTGAPIFVSTAEKCTFTGNFVDSTLGTHAWTIKIVDCTDIVVSNNNIIVGNRQGIIVSNSPGTIVIGNMVDHIGVAIVVDENSEHVIVQGNVCTGSAAGAQQRGIQIDEECHYITISGNSFRAFGTAAAESQYGIYIIHANTDDIIIEGNTILDFRTAIRADNPNATEVLFSGNQLRGYVFFEFGVSTANFLMMHNITD